MGKISESCRLVALGGLDMGTSDLTDHTKSQTPVFIQSNPCNRAENSDFNVVKIQFSVQICGFLAWLLELSLKCDLHVQKRLSHRVNRANTANVRFITKFHKRGAKFCVFCFWIIARWNSVSVCSSCGIQSLLVIETVSMKFFTLTTCRCLHSDLTLHPL